MARFSYLVGYDQFYMTHEQTLLKETLKSQGKNALRCLSFLLVVAGANAIAGEEDVSALTDVEIRELDADEDPQKLADEQRSARLDEEKQEPQRTTGFDIYGSIRVRYRGQGSDGAWEDGSSRAGIEIDQRILSKSFLIARYEAGFNLLDVLNSDTSTEEFKDTIFTRLAYVGLDTPSTKIIAGKNWSAYYEVGAFTDRFMGTGGEASGIFNAQTDGGPTGTGRADSVLQTKLSLDLPSYFELKPLKLNLQLQHGNPVPFGGDTHYGTAVGVSSIIVTEKNLTIGVAFNHAVIDLDENPSLRTVGLTGSSRALLVGARAFGERWYAGVVAARTENHEATDEGVYFESWGSEFYGRYQLSDRLWFSGGYNLLEPDSDQILAGDYRIKYSVLGFRYTFDNFRRMIFANAKINSSRRADGSDESNIYTIGVRWDLSGRGWHGSN
jgi:outer membrane protein N